MKFFIGGRYVSKTGFLVRTIEQFHGDDIYWRDQVGSGQCSRTSFRRWAGSLSPDSPEPMGPARRAKPVTQAIITVIRKELGAMQQLQKVIADVRVDKKDLSWVGISLSLLPAPLERLEESMRTFPGFGTRLRMATRIDTEAALLQRLISTAIEQLHLISEESSQAAAKPLLTALSDCSDLLNRLRLSLAPCLVH